MRIHEYGVVQGREYRGIVYRIDIIPNREIKQYKISFSNPNIKTIFMDTNDRFADVEKEAENLIDEYLNKK